MMPVRARGRDPMQRWRGLMRACVVAVVGVAAAFSPAVATPQDESEVFVAVTDRRGASVLDLTAADFVLDAGGNAVRIISATLDSVTPKIALLLDTGDGMSQSGTASALRTGVNAFLDTLDPGPVVGIVPIAPYVPRRVAFTADRDASRETLAGMTSFLGGWTQLMDGMFDTWHRRFDRDDVWPVIVVVIAGVRNVDTAYSLEDIQALVDDMVERQANVHAVVLSDDLEESVRHNLAVIAQQTNGRVLAIEAADELPRALANVAGQVNAHAAQLSSRYLIRYATTDETGPVTVRVNRSGLRLQLFLGRYPAYVFR